MNIVLVSHQTLLQDHAGVDHTLMPLTLGYSVVSLLDVQYIAWNSVNLTKSADFLVIEPTKGQVQFVYPSGLLQYYGFLGGKTECTTVR